jgi:eukaryotic-like serine/threonine-protein kinase
MDTPDSSSAPTAITQPADDSAPDVQSGAERVFAALRTSWRLGQFCIVRLLGAGGMGEVYEALDSERGASVALKVLPFMRPHRLLAFKQEFRAAASLAHPNIVELYELSVQNDTWFYSMELVRGIDLIEYVRGAHQAGPTAAVEEVRLRACLSQLIEGVHELHRAGLLHLDLKPANVLVEAGGRLVILDFGLVQTLRAGGEESGGHRSPVAGTPGYMAPEQLSGAPLTTAADWYAVGAILYEALAGRRLERGIGVTPAIRPSALRAGVPEDMEALCMRLLDPEPHTRPGVHEIQALLSVRKARVALHAAPSEIEGREGPLARLVLAHDALIRGHSQCLFVSGPAGIGKTSLVDEWVRRIASDNRTLMLISRCGEWESVPYKGFDAIVDQVASQLRTLPREEFAVLSGHAVAAAQLFPALRGFGPPEGDPGDTIPSERRSRAFRGMQAILRKLGERRPLCIVIDDLQWADADGARLLLELLSGFQPPRMLVVGVHRTGEEQSSTFLQAFFAQRKERSLAFDFEAFELSPLDEGDTRRLAARLLGPRATPETTGRVALESDGNPLFLELLVQHLWEEEDGETYDLETFTLRDVIEARLRRLSPSAQQIMDVVAVVGQPTEQRVVLSVAGVGSDAQRALSVLRRAGWTRTGGPRIHDVIEVCHTHIREGIVARMPPSRLSAVHARLASTLGEIPGADPEQLARHFFGAGDLANAGRCAEAAGDRAARVLAFDRAASNYSEALSTVTGRGDRWRSLTRRMAEALAAAGHCSSAARHFAAAGEGALPTERLELRRLAGENYLVAGHIDAGLDELRPLLREVDVPYPESVAQMVASMMRDLLRAELPPRLPWPGGAVAGSSEFRADLTWSLGKVLSAVLPLQGTYFILRSLYDARGMGDLVRTGRVLAVLGAVLSMQTGFGATLGRYYLKRARGMATSANSDYLRGFCTIGEALGALVAGQWLAAQRAADSGLELLRTRQPGVTWERNLGEGAALRALEAVGSLIELGRRAEVWQNESSERGDRWAVGGGLYFSGLARLASSEVGEVRRCARQARESLAAGSYTVQHFYTLRLEAMCDLYERRPEAAWERLDRDWHLIEKAHLLRMSLSRIDVLLLRATILLSLASVKARAQPTADEECSAIAKRLHQELRGDGAAHALSIRGLLAVRQGQPLRAMALLDRARRRYDELDMRLSSAVVERASASIAKDASRLQLAETRMRALGVKEPALWAEAFLPAVLPVRDRSALVATRRHQKYGV